MRNAANARVGGAVQAGRSPGLHGGALGDRSGVISIRAGAAGDIIAAAPAARRPHHPTALRSVRAGGVRLRSIRTSRAAARPAADR